MKDSNNRKIGYILALLIIFEVILSFYLIYQELNGKEGFCALGGKCQDVQDSKYGQIFGIKLPYLSAIAFILLLITLYTSPRLFLLGAFVGSIFSVYLTVIQIFVLKKICSNCMAVDITMILIFILGALRFRNVKKDALTKSINMHLI